MRSGETLCVALAVAVALALAVALAIALALAANCLPARSCLRHSAEFNAVVEPTLNLSRGPHSLAQPLHPHPRRIQVRQPGVSRSSNSVC